MHMLKKSSGRKSNIVVFDSVYRILVCGKGIIVSYTTLVERVLCIGAAACNDQIRSTSSVLHIHIDSYYSFSYI